MNFLYQNLNRDQIATRLLQISSEKLLVKRIVNKYRNNPFYSTIFNSEDVQGVLYETVMAVIMSLERYNRIQELVKKQELLKFTLNDKEFFKLNEKLTPSLKTKISRILKIKSIELDMQLPIILSASNGNLKLDTEAHITGYLIVAFTNNIRKIYAKHQTDKRSFHQMVYLDSYNDEDVESTFVKNKMEAVGSVEPIKEKEYNQILVDMALYLKKIDKKQNQVNQNQKSQLTKLFCSIVNPKKVEDSSELRNHFGWSQYLLNKNKETLIKSLREEFSDCQSEILGYFDQREQFRKAD